MGDIKSKGVQVLVISQDSPELNRKTAKKNGLNFNFLSDGDMAVAKAFGLAFTVDEKTVKLYMDYNIDLVALYGRAKPLMSTPAVFMADTKGKIAFSYVNPVYSVRLKPEVLKAAMDAYLVN